MTIERLARLRRSVRDQRVIMSRESYGRRESEQCEYMSPRILRYMMTRLRVILLSSPDVRRDIIELLNETDKITVATMQLKVNTE